ncbi:MAG TPA: amidohydrolase family protein [Candidatus Hydrogenedentes bacterium]|nr:amidohydrolase family protein [Candidatus Hydrogenedentota bacterium]HPG65578.1 amidohydrolase family protein [Candidatus Hydrogenedentota bacterium]
MASKSKRKKTTGQETAVQKDPPRADEERPSGPDAAKIVLGTLVVVLLLALVGLFCAFRVRIREAEASERHAVASASDASVPLDALRAIPVINAHEHLFMRSHLDKYLSACDRLGVVQTLFVGSPDFTLKGAGHSPKTGNDENNRVILDAAAEFPGKIVPFCTLHPDDEDKVQTLEAYVAEGGKGLKLYTGHGSFWDRPLDAPEMLPVYEYCERTQLPICWHVNLLRYADEFSRVMLKFPRLIVIVPHFGVTFYRPTGSEWAVLQKLLDNYPGLYTDTSFGTRDILVAGLEVVSQYPDVFRAFFEKYQDRIFWGTDMVVTGNKEKTEEWVEAVLRACRDVLEKDTYHFFMAARGSPYAAPGSPNIYGRLRGLALPDSILRKVYHENFERLFPAE